MSDTSAEKVYIVMRPIQNTYSYDGYLDEIWSVFLDEAKAHAAAEALNRKKEDGCGKAYVEIHEVE